MTLVTHISQVDDDNSSSTFFNICPIIFSPFRCYWSSSWSSHIDSAMLHLVSCSVHLTNFLDPVALMAVTNVCSSLTTISGQDRVNKIYWAI